MKYINRKTNIIVILLTFLLTAGCTPAFRGTPVRDRSARIVFTGYSILPPQSNGWKIGGMDDYSIVFGRDPIVTQNGPTTIVAMARIIHREEPFKGDDDFKAAIKELNLAGESSRFKFKEYNSKIERFNDATCVSYSHTFEDHGAKGYEGTTFTLFNEGLACMHPDDNSTVVEIVYSQRVAPNEKPVEMNDVEGYLRSMRFKTLTDNQDSKSP